MKNEWEQLAAAAKSLQLCPSLCDLTDGSPPGSSVPGILQARTLEWVAISFFNAWNWKVKVKSLSHVRLLETPWSAALQAPLSMEFSRQEYWSGVPLPSPTLSPRKPLIFPPLLIHLFLMFRVNGITYVVPCDWDLPFSVIFSRFILKSAPVYIFFNCWVIFHCKVMKNYSKRKIE